MTERGDKLEEIKVNIVRWKRLIAIVLLLIFINVLFLHAAPKPPHIIALLLFFNIFFTYELIMTYYDWAKNIIKSKKEPDLIIYENGLSGEIISILTRKKFLSWKDIKEFKGITESFRGYTANYIVIYTYELNKHWKELPIYRKPRHF